MVIFITVVDDTDGHSSPETYSATATKNFGQYHLFSFLSSVLFFSDYVLYISLTTQQQLRSHQLNNKTLFLPICVYIHETIWKVGRSVGREAGCVPLFIVARQESRRGPVERRAPATSPSAYTSSGRSTCAAAANRAEGLVQVLHTKRPLVKARVVLFTSRTFRLCFSLLAGPLLYFLYYPHGQAFWGTGVHYNS